MVIDFGEITAALSAAYGAGQGWTDNKALQRMAERVGIVSTEKFGAYADSIAQSTLPHVYEYRGESSGQQIVDTPAGRLFEFHPKKIPGGISSFVQFKQSRVPGGPSEVLRAAFPKMSGHYFPDKAEHLETTPTLRAEAGVQEFTERTRPGQPRALIFERNGQIFFRKWRVWQNEFYGRFDMAFRVYFTNTFITSSDQRMQAFAARLTPYIHSVVARSALKARAGSIPRHVLPGMIRMTDSGRPFVGIRIKPTIAKNAKQQVQKQLEKEMLTAWRA